MAHAVLDGLTFDGLQTGVANPLNDVENWDGFQKYLDRGAGVLIATAHFGSWELMAKVMAHQGVPLHAVVRPLKGALNAKLSENRVTSGMQLIFPGGAIRQSLKALRKGHIVAMLIDQSLPHPSALWVPFFGRSASMTPAFAMVALKSKAPVFIAVAIREGSKVRLQIEGPVNFEPAESFSDNVQRLSEQVTARLEKLIRLHPEQWLWLHRRWKISAAQQSSNVDPKGKPEVN